MKLNKAAGLVALASLIVLFGTQLAGALSAPTINGYSLSSDCSTVISGGYAPVACSQQFQAVQQGIQINTVTAAGIFSNAGLTTTQIFTGIIVLVIVLALLGIVFGWFKR